MKALAQSPLLALERCCEDPLMYSPSTGDSGRLDSADIVDTKASPFNGELNQHHTTLNTVNFRNRERAHHYGAIFVCLIILERWLELGVRPSQKVLQDISSVFCADQPTQRPQKGEDLPVPVVVTGWELKERLLRLWENPMDDLSGIKSLTKDTRRFLWNAAMDPPLDEHLVVGPSKIPRAQKGLFAARHLPARTICCYYTGDIHSTKSSQSPSMLPDASYLLRIGTLSRRPWWYNALSPCDEDDDNDNQHGGSSSVYSSLQAEWDQIVGDARTTPEFFVDPTNLNIKARYINDCLEEGLYNVEFILDPRTERAAVVTLRDIEAGEELYVSYGKAYWDSVEATIGIVPQRLGSFTKNKSNQ